MRSSQPQPQPKVRGAAVTVAVAVAVALVILAVGVACCYRLIPRPRLLEAFAESRSGGGGGQELHDGERPVRRLAVLALFRDNAPYLERHLFPQLRSLERAYACTFEYYFLENNSSDATPALLRAFLADGPRRGRVITLDLPDFKADEINFERTERMARLRNELVDAVVPRLAADGVPYCLFIDSNVMFKADALGRMFAHEPRKADVGLMGAFTLEARLGGDGEVADITTHYYDTFALVDLRGQNSWPSCPFDTCAQCPPPPRTGRIQVDGGLVDVASCFGGFALIDVDVLRNGRVRWGTVEMRAKPSGTGSLCEHVLFNARLAAATGMRVAIASDVDDVYWVP